MQRREVGRDVILIMRPVEFTNEISIFLVCKGHGLEVEEIVSDMTDQVRSIIEYVSNYECRLTNAHVRARARRESDFAMRPARWSVCFNINKKQIINI